MGFLKEAKEKTKPDKTLRPRCVSCVFCSFGDGLVCGVHRTGASAQPEGVHHAAGRPSHL